MYMTIINYTYPYQTPKGMDMNRYNDHGFVWGFCLGGAEGLLVCTLQQWRISLRNLYMWIEMFHCLVRWQAKYLSMAKPCSKWPPSTTIIYHIMHFLTRVVSRGLRLPKLKAATWPQKSSHHVIPKIHHDTPEQLKINSQTQTEHIRKSAPIK